jgi:6-pyruvoyl-tetrahydropterin synthase
MAQITETIQNLDARERSTAEATRFHVNHNTKLMHALKEQLVENSCRCENIPAPQVQEYSNSSLCEGLSRQLTQLKEELEFTRSSITQGISHHLLNLDKELAGQVKAQTQNDLEILYDATKNHLQQLHQASRDCIAQAGIAIAGELKPIASAGSVITERISNTLKKHMEETVQCNRREFEKSTIQVCGRSLCFQSDTY